MLGSHMKHECAAACKAAPCCLASAPKTPAIGLYPSPRIHARLPCPAHASTHVIVRMHTRMHRCDARWRRATARLSVRSMHDDSFVRACGHRTHSTGDGPNEPYYLLSDINIYSTGDGPNEPFVTGTRTIDTNDRRLGEKLSGRVISLQHRTCCRDSTKGRLGVDSQQSCRRLPAHANVATISNPRL